MKNIIFLSVFLMTGITSWGQSNGKASITTTPTVSKSYTPQGVVKASNKDTLVNADTGYVWFYVNTNYDLTFDLLTTTVSGTVASTSNILYGAVGTNSTYPASADWHAVTGVTTYCADCIGASSTTVPGASKHYVWQVPHSAGAQFTQYRIQSIQTGTATATYKGSLTTGY